MRNYQNARLLRRKVNGRWLYKSDPDLSSCEWTNSPELAIYFSAAEVPPVSERAPGDRYVKAATVCL